MSASANNFHHQFETCVEFPWSFSAPELDVSPSCVIVMNFKHQINYINSEIQKGIKETISVFFN